MYLSAVKIIKILEVQFCSLLKAVVLKCQLLILFVASKIVLSESKNCCCVSGSLSERLPSVWLSFFTEAK